MGTRRRSQREARRKARDRDHRVNEALTDLSAYALTLDVECHRLDDRMLELAKQDSSAAERRALVRERAEMAEELNAFRRIIAALARTLSARRGLTH